MKQIEIRLKRNKMKIKEVKMEVKVGYRNMFGV